MGTCALQQGRGYRCSLSRCLRTCAGNSDSYKSAALTPTGWTIVAALTCRLRHKQLGEMLNSLNVFSQMRWGGACLLSASRFAFVVRHPAACGVRRFVCVCVFCVPPACVLWNYTQGCTCSLCEARCLHRAMASSTCKSGTMDTPNKYLCRASGAMQIII